MLLAELKSPDLAPLSKDTPVVFPIAALEQHGRHLPLFTDSLLLGEVVRRAAERVGERMIFAPLQWLGSSHHHMDSPGTLSAEPRTYLDLLTGLLECFIAHGFKRLLLLNGHGGNIVPGAQAVFEVRQRHRERRDLLLLSATYWLTVRDPRQVVAGLEQARMGHACEWETSMMLRLAPSLVGDHRGAEVVPFGAAFEPADRGWTMTDRSAPGHVGDPRPATAEKGEALFRAFADGVTTLLERVLLWDGRSWDGCEKAREQPESPQTSSTTG